MAQETSLRELVAINLQYDAGNKALSTRAIAQLVAKILFASGRLVSQGIDAIAAEAARLLELKRISVEQVAAGLQFLHELRFARESSGKWLLTDMGYKAIAADVSRAQARVAGVLARHFPSRVAADRLLPWFNDACVRFYELYGAQWAAALARQRASEGLTRASVATLLQRTIKEHGLTQFHDELVAGFHAFIGSGHRDDIEHNWSLSQSLLAARLVAINVGPDPVTSKEFVGVLMLLDTNVLLVTALEGHRLARSLEKLGHVLKQIGVDAAYIEETRGEYRGVVASKRGDVAAAFAAYPVSILRDSRDAFITTAIERQAYRTEDLATFFDEILDPPESIGEAVAVRLLADHEVLKLAALGSTDEHLKKEIGSVWERIKGRKKKLRATEHDAALTRVAEGLRDAGQKCVVLTLDRSMHEHAQERAGSQGLPQWITIDALIQILAVDSAGPEMDAADFGPLMASIIHHQVEPIMNTYRAEDLALMLDVEDRCARLPEDDIKSIASLVAKERMRGRRRDDPELALSVRREFQKGKFHLADDAARLSQQLLEREATVRGQSAQLATKQTERTIASQRFIAKRSAELRRVANGRFLFKVITGITTAVLVGYGLFLVIEKTTGPSIPAYVAAFIGLCAPLVAITGWLIKTVVPEWRAARKHVEENASAELERDIEAGKVRSGN